MDQQVHEAIKLIRAPDYEEDTYSILMDEGVDTTKLVKKLCQDDEEIIWTTCKNN